MYRKLPLNQIKARESFRKSVAVCLSKVNIEMCQQLLGNGRGSMLGYHHQALALERKTEEKKSRVLSRMKKYRRSIDPTGMHSPFLENSCHR
jgi:hypothetical protein